MLVRTFSWVVGASLVALAGVLGFMATDRAIPIELVSAKINSTNVRPGGELVWDIKFIQHRRCSIYSERIIFDSTGTPYTLEPISYVNGIGEVGEVQDMTLRVPVPTEVSFGTARYEGTTVYKCNILHNIWPVYGPYNPVFFEVVPL